MADLTPLAAVTKFFASGKTRRDCILRHYGEPTTTESGGRGKGDFDAEPITLFEDPSTGDLELQPRGADQAVRKTFYTLAKTRGVDDIAGAQGDEIVMEDGDIYTIETWRPWRDGPGDEVTCVRVGRVGNAPY